MRQSILILVSTVCGVLIGIALCAHLRHSNRFQGRTQEEPVYVVADRHNHGGRCGAPYYGMGDGDGVYDPRCFELQEKLSDAAWRGDVDGIRRLLRFGASADSHSGNSLPPLYTPTKIVFAVISTSGKKVTPKIVESDTNGDGKEFVS
jgi:hypothetical protein